MYEHRGTWRLKIGAFEAYLVEHIERPQAQPSLSYRSHFYYSLKNGSDGSWNKLKPFATVPKQGILETKLQKAVREYQYQKQHSTTRRIV